MTDTISDMLIRIKNAQAVKKEQVTIPFSNFKYGIAKILKNYGFIADCERKSKKSKKSEHDYILVTLKYQENIGAISGLKMISKPSRRMYAKVTDIKPIRSGYGISIISTPGGLMSSIDARKNNFGGEVICEIW